MNVRALDNVTCSDLAALVERHNPVWGGCWCVNFHFESVGRAHTPEGDDEDEMMTENDEKAEVVECSCGTVALLLRSDPIVTVACYCDTCQEGSRRIEALPNAPAVRESDGGTAYVSYRKDRLSYVKGRDFLKDYRLDRALKTNRVVASCCNSAMFMRFDDARHWIPIYRARFADPPALEMRICTSAMANGRAIPNDVPSYKDYSIALLFKLLWSRVAMLLGR